MGQTDPVQFELLGERSIQDFKSYVNKLMTNILIYIDIRRPLSHCPYDVFDLEDDQKIQKWKHF